MDRTVTFATLTFGGVLDECPDLTICFRHGGGYTCYGIGRMDYGWQVRAEARTTSRSHRARICGAFTTIASSTRSRRYAISSIRWESTGSSSAPTGPMIWSLTGRSLDPRHAEPHPGGERGHPVEEPGAAARSLSQAGRPPTASATSCATLWHRRQRHGDADEDHSIATRAACRDRAPRPPHAALVLRGHPNAPGGGPSGSGVSGGSTSRIEPGGPGGEGIRHGPSPSGEVYP